MKKYTNIKDISNLRETIKDAILLKNDPYEFSDLGKISNSLCPVA